MVMEVRDSGMKRMLRLRDGDSERGSGIQGETRTRLGGAQLRRATIGAQPNSYDSRGNGEGKLSIRLYFHKYKPYILGLQTT